MGLVIKRKMRPGGGVDGVFDVKVGRTEILMDGNEVVVDQVVSAWLLSWL